MRPDDVIVELGFVQLKNESCAKVATLSALLELDCRRTVRVGPFLGINKLATPRTLKPPASTFGRVSKLANSRISATATTATASFGSVGGGSCKTARRNDRRSHHRHQNWASDRRGPLRVSGRQRCYRDGTIDTNLREQSKNNNHKFV